MPERVKGYRYVMKTGLIRAAAVFLNLVYMIFKLLPVRKKVTFISRQSNVVSEDVKLICGEMKSRHPEYEQVVLFRTLDPGLPAKAGYCLHMLRQMYHVATSEMVVLDTYCIVVSFLKQRESLVVIQMWHAMGSLKKFGYSTLGKKEGSSREIAEAMRMHRNYTYVFCSGEECRPYFAEAFHVPLEKMVVMPLPRLDLMLDQTRTEKLREKIYHVYPQLQDAGKEILVYAPTFRRLKRAGDDEEELVQVIEHLADALDMRRYVLVLKLHPLSNVEIRKPGVILDHKFDTVDFCQVADKIILDYSAVVFEVMLLKKPMYFYAYDYKAYTENRDFYLDYRKDMPGVIVWTQAQLLEKLEEDIYDAEKNEVFIQRMMGNIKGISYTGDVVDFMEKVCYNQNQ